MLTDVSSNGRLQSVSGGRGRAESVTWYLSAGVVGAALLISIPYLVAVWRDAPWAVAGPSPLITAGLLAFLTAISATFLLGLSAVAARRPLSAVLIALAVLTAIRILVTSALDAPLISDWAHYHRLALGALLGAPPLADVPMGYPILLGFAYQLSGISVATGEALNVIASGLVGVGLAAWVWRWAGGRAAALAVGVLAISPSQVFFASLLGSETAFGVAVVGTALCATEMIAAERSGRPRLALGLAILVGVLLGYGTWLRATGLVLIASIALLPWIVRLPWRRAVPLSAAIVVAGMITLLPVIAANRTLLDRASASTSLYLGWQLYVGANTSTDGTYNKADAEVVDATIPGFTSDEIGYAYAAGNFDAQLLQRAADRDEAAFRLATARLQGNLGQIPALLALKFRGSWGRADNSVAWALDRVPSEASALSPLAHLAAQVWWIGALGGASAWYWLSRRQRPIAGLVVAAIVIPIAVSTLVLESQVRYHEPVVPLLAGLTGAALARLSTWRARPNDGPLRPLGPAPGPGGRSTLGAPERSTDPRPARRISVWPIRAAR